MPRSSHNSSDGSKIEKGTNGRSSRQTRAKARTSNACEACKRRKTKCSGFPSPCDVCKKAETYCNFNPKLDTRRKVAYSSSTVQDRQQFMITALLQTIKHVSEPDLQQLVGLIRGPSRPDAVAHCLQKHFKVLQSKNILAKVSVDSTDVISFGLQGLCGHRKGRPRPSGTETESSMRSGSSESRTSPLSVADDDISSTSSFDAIEELDETEDIAEESPLDGEDNSFGAYGLGSAEMFDLAVNEPQYHLDSLGHDSQQPGQHPSRRSSFPPPNHPGMQYFNNSAPFPNSDDQHHDLFGSGMNLSSHPAYELLPSNTADFSGRYGRNQFVDTSMSNHNMVEYYYCLANGIPTTLAPTAALKFGNDPPRHPGVNGDRPSRHGHALKSNG